MYGIQDWLYCNLLVLHTPMSTEGSERRKEHERMLKLITANAAKEGRLDLQLKAVGMLMQLYGTSVNSKLEVTGKNGGPLAVKEMSKNDIARLVSDAGLKPA